MVLKIVERYLRKNGVSATEFGQRVARDPRLVFDLRAGREPGSRMVARIHAYIESGR